MLKQLRYQEPPITDREVVDGPSRERVNRIAEQVGALEGLKGETVYCNISTGRVDTSRLIAVNHYTLDTMGELLKGDALDQTMAAVGMLLYPAVVLGNFEPLPPEIIPITVS
ncbi:MAG: hypothetical protein ABIH37_01685 [archaeon]